MRCGRRRDGRGHINIGGVGGSSGGTGEPGEEGEGPVKGGCWWGWRAIDILEVSNSARASPTLAPFPPHLFTVLCPYNAGVLFTGNLRAADMATAAMRGRILLIHHHFLLPSLPSSSVRTTTPSHHSPGHAANVCWSRQPSMPGFVAALAFLPLPSPIFLPHLLSHLLPPPILPPRPAPSPTLGFCPSPAQESTSCTATPHLVFPFPYLCAAASSSRLPRHGMQGGGAGGGCKLG
ncbi:unnamed protein product [Closterium sp. NIES-64]|nr:unnamed protein product [Closterium sp. NIES-64]